MAILIYLFRLSCDIYYKISFSQNYSYYLFDYSFSNVNFIVSWIFTILLSLRFHKIFNKTNKKPQRLSTYVVFLLYLLSYIPTMTLCAFENFSIKFTILVSVYWTLIIFLEYAFCSIRKAQKVSALNEPIQPIAKNNTAIVVLSVAVIFSILGFSYYYRGFAIDLNLDDVYVLRYGEIRSLGGILKYIYIWTGVLASVLCIYSIQNKKYCSFAIWVFLLILYYSISGTKTTIFVMLASIFAVILKLKDNMWLVPTLFIMLNCCAIIEPLVEIGYFNGFWGLRTLFLPSNLTHMYYEYFSANGPDYWARSFMRHFGAVSKYDMDFGHIIDIEMYHASGEGNSNTGMFGSAYANWGDFCIIVYPCIMLVVFAFMNWCSKAVSIEYSYVLLINYAFALQNCDPFIVLMTNGLIVVGLIFKFILFPQKRSLKSAKKVVVYQHANQ